MSQQDKVSQSHEVSQDFAEQLVSAQLSGWDQLCDVFDEHISDEPVSCSTAAPKPLALKTSMIKEEEEFESLNKAWGTFRKGLKALPTSAAAIWSILHFVSLICHSN